MLTIRYTRIGKKNQPSFKIVVVDKRKSSTGGRSVEILGFSNPLTKKNNIDKERVKYWISKGAQPSDSVYNLLVKNGILTGDKKDVHKKKKGKEGEKPATPVAASTPAAAPAAAPVAAPAVAPATPANPEPTK